MTRFAGRISTRTLSRSAEVRALLGVTLGSVPGFVLPFALTWRLTAGHLSDAYFYAFALALLPATLLSVVLETNVLPVAEESKRQGSAALMRLTRRLALQSSLLAIIVYGIIAAVGVALIDAKSTWPSQEKQLCIQLLFIFGVFVIAVATSSVLAGCLHALGDFFTTTCSQGLRAIFPLLFVAVISRSANGVLLSASALAAGEIVRAVFLGVRLRVMSRALAMRMPEEREPRSMWAAAIPHGLALFASLANPTIDRIVAASLATGSVTLLDLTEKVLYAPLVALNYSIVLVAGARWAKHPSDDVRGLEADFIRTKRRAVWLSFAAAALILAASFGATLLAAPEVAHVRLTTFLGVLAILLAGLPAAAVVSTSLRFLTISRYTLFLPLAALIAVTINAAGDILGAKLIGIYGIALASTAIRCVDAVTLSILCRRRLRMLRSGSHEPAAVQVTN